MGFNANPNLLGGNRTAVRPALGTGNSLIAQLERQMLANASPQAVADANELYQNQPYTSAVDQFRAIRTATDQQNIAANGTNFPGTSFSLVRPAQFSQSRFDPQSPSQAPPQSGQAPSLRRNNMFFNSGPYAQLAMQLAGILGR